MNSLAWIVGQLVDMKPGYRITFGDRVIADVQPPDGFTPCDWIMENVVGSAYEFMYRIDDSNRCVVFHRLATPLPVDGPMTYVSPDRRHFCKQGPDGLWRPTI